MQRPIALALVMAVLIAPITPPVEKAVAQPEEEPPSIPLSVEGIDPFAQNSRAELTEIKIGVSYHEQEQERIRVAEAKRLADESAKKHAALQKRNSSVAPRSQQKSSSQELGGIKERARQLVIAKWDASQWEAFDFIVTHESGWNTQARNKTSGACGLGQALPCSKMPGGLSATAEQQINWVITYISNRYGTPRAAKSFWDSHRWY